jgi:glutaredoxin
MENLIKSILGSTKIIIYNDGNSYKSSLLFYQYICDYCLYDKNFDTKIVSNFDFYDIKNHEWSYFIEKIDKFVYLFIDKPKARTIMYADLILFITDNNIKIYKNRYFFDNQEPINIKEIKIFQRFDKINKIKNLIHDSIEN